MPGDLLGRDGSVIATRAPPSTELGLGLGLGVENGLGLELALALALGPGIWFKGTPAHAFGYIHSSTAVPLR